MGLATWETLSALLLLMVTALAVEKENDGLINLHCQCYVILHLADPMSNIYFKLLGRALGDHWSLLYLHMILS